MFSRGGNRGAIARDGDDRTSLDLYVYVVGFTTGAETRWGGGGIDDAVKLLDAKDVKGFCAAPLVRALVRTRALSEAIALDNNSG